MAYQERGIMARYLRSRIVYVLLVSLVLFHVFQSWSHAGSLFVWPVQGTVINEFGYAAYQKGGHRGIDIEISKGESVKAAAAGRVYWTGVGPEGAGVGIEHEQGIRTTYMPVNRSVRMAQAVGQGDIIGKVAGSSDRSSTRRPHLHFAVKKSPYGEKDYLDPRGLLPPPTEQSASGEPNPHPASSKLISSNQNSQTGQTESLNPGRALNPSSIEVQPRQSLSVQKSMTSSGEAELQRAKSSEAGISDQEAVDAQKKVPAQGTSGGSVSVSSSGEEVKRGARKSNATLLRTAAKSGLRAAKRPAGAHNEYPLNSAGRVARPTSSVDLADEPRSQGPWSTVLLAITGSLVLLCALRKAAPTSIRFPLVPLQGARS